MRGELPSPHIDRGGEAWSEIETLVDETANLARMPMSSHEFHSELLKRLVQATGALSAAIWRCQEGGQCSIEAEINTRSDTPTKASLLAARSQNIINVAKTRKASSIMAHQSLDLLRNPTDHTAVVQPTAVDEETIAVLELFHDGGASPIEAKNVEQLVAVFSDFVAEFHRNRQLRELRHREAAWTDLERYVDHVHRTLDLKGTGFAIANEATRVACCDRVTVFQRQGSRCRTLAISGIDSFDRRSTQVRAAEQLARAVVASDEPLWYAGEAQSLAPQLERRLNSYLDSTPVRTLAVLPLNCDSSAGEHTKVPGVLLFERFESAPWSDSHRRRIEFACRHGAVALQNANELTGLPLIGVSRLLQACLSIFALRHIPKTFVVLVLLAAASAALVLVPAAFEIRGEGRLMPTRYCHIFAPADGVIEELHVEHAQAVGMGTPLLQLRRADLNLEETRLIGEMLTSQKRLESVRSSILHHKSASASSPSEFDELTSEEARLEISLDSLRKQQTILDQERDALAVASPIDGEVLTWGIEDLLSLRPVRRGERLLSIADPNGPWQLELRIADHDIEHVLAARRNTEELMVNFILTSHSGDQYRGTIKEISMSTELDGRDQPTVLVRVAVDREQLLDLRPGASVVANVDCGRRPIGYVWFRELFDVIRTRLLF